MVNSPLIRPYFLGGVALGGYLRFPWDKMKYARGPPGPLVSYSEIHHFERNWGSSVMILETFFTGSSNVWMYLDHLKNSSWSGVLPRCKWLTCRSRWWLNNDFPNSNGWAHPQRVRPWWDLTPTKNSVEKKAKPTVAWTGSGIWVFPKIGENPPKWMVYNGENPMNKWMIWGVKTPIFGLTPL